MTATGPGGYLRRGTMDVNCKGLTSCRPSSSDRPVLRIAAFSDGSNGGNPAGVVVGDTLPSESEMQSIAAEVGYSETVFAAPQEDGWRVRFFSPEEEVAFCGHATIALGSVLAEREGQGLFQLDPPRPIARRQTRSCCRPRLTCLISRSLTLTPLFHLRLPMPGTTISFWR